MKSLILALLLLAAPPDRLPQFPGHTETVEQARTRYASIAADIVAEVEASPPVRGLDRRDTAILVAAMAIGESGLARDADVGPCHRRGAWRARCDHGRSVSMWQLMTDRGKLTHDGETYTKQQLFSDRRLAIRVALSRLRRSVNACYHLPPRYRLSAYGAGRCMRLEGAAKRFRLFSSLRMKANKHERR